MCHQKIISQTNDEYIFEVNHVIIVWVNIKLFHAFVKGYFSKVFHLPFLYAEKARMLQDKLPEILIKERKTEINFTCQNWNNEPNFNTYQTDLLRQGTLYIISLGIWKSNANYCKLQAKQ